MSSVQRDHWIERLAAFAAFLSLLCVILLPGRPRVWQESLGDFKLVYASAAALSHSGDAYGYGGLSRAFREAGVVQPASWWGHNPVYPFFTLLTVSPLLFLPMIPAAYLWAFISYLVIALTALRLTRYAERRYRLGLAWRLAIIALVAASPLVSFALELANLSLVTACLCIYVVIAPVEENPWWHAVALALAMLLKPHLALWVIVALFFLSPDRAHGSGRNVAWRGSALFGIMLTAMSLYLAVRGQLMPLLTSYTGMLHAEAVSGSMDFRNHQAFQVPAQITALGMLLGYWIHTLHTIDILLLVLLPPLGLALLWLSLRIAPEHRLVLVCAWTAFGLVATYHRAHDGVVLLLLLPWALSRLRTLWRDGPAWAVLLFYGLFSIDVPREWWQGLATHSFLRPVADLLFDRQVATAASLLCLSLVLFLLRAAFWHTRDCKDKVDERLKTAS